MSRRDNVSRRAFVAGLSAATIVAADQLWQSSRVKSRVWRGLDLAEVTLESFAAHQGTSFYFEHGQQADWLEVELVAARKLRRAGKRPPTARAPFSLLFRGPNGLRLPQETYTVSHEHLGTLNMFLTPGGQPQEDPVMYEAVFA